VTCFRSLAVAQTCPVKGDVAANVAEHLRLLQLATSEGARVVVFPELSLTGYELELAADLAFSIDDARLAPLLAAANAASALLIVGAPVRLATRLHIGAFILRPDGTTDVYTKHHLGAFPPAAARDGTVPPAEATVFAPGDRNPAVVLDGATAAVAICADAGRPDHVERAAASGATSYLASMFVIPSEFDGHATKLQAYAARHSLVVPMANFGGPTGGLAAAGRSSIWAPTGDLLVRLGTTGAGVAIATQRSGAWRGHAVAPRTHVA
jgi:predicted amidohydrolase